MQKWLPRTPTILLYMISHNTHVHGNLGMKKIALRRQGQKSTTRIYQ